MSHLIQEPVHVGLAYFKANSISFSKLAALPSFGLLDWAVPRVPERIEFPNTRKSHLIQEPVHVGQAYSKANVISISKLAALPFLGPLDWAAPIVPERV